MGWFQSQLESRPRTIQTHSHQSTLRECHWCKPPPANSIAELLIKNVACGTKFHNFNLTHWVGILIRMCDELMTDSRTMDDCSYQSLLNNALIEQTNMLMKSCHKIYRCSFVRQRGRLGPALQDLEWGNGVISSAQSRHLTKRWCWNPKPSHALWIMAVPVVWFRTPGKNLPSGFAWATLPFSSPWLKQLRCLRLPTSH